MQGGPEARRRLAGRWSEERAEPPDSCPSQYWRAGGARESSVMPLAHLIQDYPVFSTKTRKHDPASATRLSSAQRRAMRKVDTESCTEWIICLPGKTPQTRFARALRPMRHAPARRRRRGSPVLLSPAFVACMTGNACASRGSSVRPCARKCYPWGLSNTSSFSRRTGRNGRG